MDTTAIAGAMTTLLGELVLGAHGPAYMLNDGDAGLLGSLDRLSATDASQASHGGASIAAHADHVRYGLTLMNRWSTGENPFADADWTRSWRIAVVSDDEWRSIRDGVRDEAHRWLDTVSVPRDVNDVELNGMLSSIAHVAYHLGAIRQLDKSTRGPRATRSN